MGDEFEALLSPPRHLMSPISLQLGRAKPSGCLNKALTSSLRSPAQVDGTQGFLLQPKKDLESPSLTRFQAQFPYHDSRTMTGSLSPRA